MINTILLNAGIFSFNLDSFLKDFMLKSTVFFQSFFGTTLESTLQLFLLKLDVFFQSFSESLIGKSVLIRVLLLVISFGTINWIIWIGRRLRSAVYVPLTGNYEASTSVVVPVYKEEKHVLKDTVESILANNPDEVILVLDISEQETSRFIKHNIKDSRVKTVFIEEPGKRPALAKGIELASSKIVILVDSDTSWQGSKFLHNLIQPFEDDQVGGVGSRQILKHRDSWSLKIMDWIIDLKYSDYVKSDSISGSVLCLSGRTAAYRRDIVLPVLDQLVNEKFLWHKCVGGDDTRLTSLVLKAGYKTMHQDNAVAEAVFPPSFIVYLKQKVRWSRNSFRAYLKALFSSWPWKQKRFVYLVTVYHTLFPGLTALLGIGLLIYSIYIQNFFLVLVLLTIGFITRLVKGISHLRKYPSDIYLIPLVFIYYDILSFIKLYAFFTLALESWSGSRGSYKIKEGKRV